MVTDGQTVETFEVTRQVSIQAWDMGDDGIKYDWVSQMGSESSSLFDSIEDAKADADIYA